MPSQLPGPDTQIAPIEPVRKGRGRGAGAAAASGDGHTPQNAKVSIQVRTVQQDQANINPDRV